MTDRAARVQLSTGVALNVTEAGSADASPVILLHGFPESHRTWRHVVPKLSGEFRLIVPDLRGFGESDRPKSVTAYRPDRLIADIFALADARGVDRFALAGHDWGGAIAWPAALSHPDRVTRLVVINSPHPVIFQKSLIDDPAQRAASQYIRAFRDSATEAMIAARGFDWFFERTYGPHVDLARIEPEERSAMIAQWSRPGALGAMLNWYRATGLVVPAMGENAPCPPWMADFPKLHVPALVIWGMRDPALLPVQLDGLDEWVEDLTIVRLPDAGHFAPWEAPDAIADAMRAFLNDRSAARAAR